jgi:hypothetical protein
MSGESITIAPSRDDEHSLCYDISLPKTELFDPELLILRIQRRFGRKTMWYSESAPETTSDEMEHDTSSGKKKFSKI